MNGFLLQDNEAVAGLRKRLSDCPSVTRYGPDEPETLAHALSDIERPMREFLDVWLPKLADPTVKGQALEDLLWEVTTDEVRHMLYHLRDPEYFRQLDPVNPKDDRTRD